MGETVETWVLRLRDSYKGNSLSEDYTRELQQSFIREYRKQGKTTTHLQEEIQREKLKETLLQGTGIYTGE
jgi:hypothetical protein